jgi:hypothetical protein
MWARKTNNVAAYSWGATQNAVLPASGDVLFQFSRKPGADGSFTGFPNNLRAGENGMSVQVAKASGHDPIKAFSQQMGRPPTSGDFVRQTTVGRIERWGGAVVYDGVPPGHATIYSDNWGKSFSKLWENIKPIID